MRRTGSVTSIDILSHFVMTAYAIADSNGISVIGRHEAIQWADNKQMTKHVTGRNEAIRNYVTS
ncbi:MAG: hypothetical protein LBF85_07120 [Tannerella sp.]|nr:hypothetical protein [Tannerella sp.]